MDRFDVTVAVCTWNRAQSLGRTLHGLRALRIPPGLTWEVLVVNNNCTDATDSVIAAFAGPLPIRGLHEPRQGLSHARNRAVAEARGDYILWTDDDAVPEPGWLSAYADAFRTWPEAAVFGGPIMPDFEDGPPDWLAAALDSGRIADAYARRDLGPAPAPLSAEGNLVPYGANYAIRTAEQRTFPYDHRLGFHGHDMVNGEETAVVTAILGAGFEGRWVPGARVRHVIPKARQTAAYLRDYFVGAGRTAVRRAALADPASVPTAPRGLLRQALVSRLAYYFTRATAAPGVWCVALDRAASDRGRLMEYRALARVAGEDARTRHRADKAEGCAG